MLRTVCFLLSFTGVVFAFVSSSATQNRLTAAPTSRTLATGLILIRLPQRERERFEAVEDLVFAEDENFQPLHPTLRSLWEWVETSGHSVFVEVTQSNRIATCTAGSFEIAEFDPKNHRHTAVLKLNLAAIDQAQVGPQTTRANGFTPFAELGRVERYAEVLGHELAHTVYILTNRERTRAVEEMVEQTNELFLQVEWRSRKAGLSEQLKQRLARRDLLLRDLEAQAEAMEAVIWRELKTGQAQRTRLRNRFSGNAVATQAGRK